MLIPEILSRYISQLVKGYHPHTESLIIALIAVAAGIIFRLILYFTLVLYRKGGNLFATMLLKRLNGIFFLVFPIFFLLLVMPVIQMPISMKVIVLRILQISFIITLAWLLVKLMYVIQDVLLHKYNIEKPDNIRERKIQTQILFIRKMVIIIIVILAVGFVFTRFEGMRRIGSGILTSAGIAGVIIGFAAQKSIANLLAGLQIAFTQPIRLDDVVIVEGEYGRIEEITLTYVVVRLWDLRRMVLPITYFIEKPFQNWTRNEAALIGSVYIFADYVVPIDALRTELERLVHNSPLWDKSVCALQVTNTDKQAIEIRCLVSAHNSGDLFDIRCMVRENLITFVQKNYPESLPRFRADIFTKTEVQPHLNTSLPNNPE